VNKKKVEEAKRKKEKDGVSSKGDVVSNPVLSKNQQSPVLSWVSKK